MKYSSVFKATVSAAALTVVAGAASAATTQFGSFSSNGTFDYLGKASGDGGIDVTATLNSDSAVGSLETGGIFDDTSVEREYALNYTFGVKFGGTSLSETGSTDLGTFSIDALKSFVANQPSSGSVGLFSGATANYSDVTFPTSSSIDLSYVLTADENASQEILDFFGFTGNQIGSDDGTYTFEAQLVSSVAPVPLPAAAPLLVFGIGGLVAVGRRRRKAA